MDALTSAPSTRSMLGRTAYEDAAPMSEILLLQEQLNSWEEKYHTDGFDSVAALRRVAEILEAAMEDFLQMNPDPLDDRHPQRTHPTASYGVMLKAIIRKENFMQTLIVSYLMARDNVPLSETAARVLLSCVPGLDSDTVFSDPEELIPCLYKYASTGGSDALQAYSFGLLASAMEVQDNAGKYRKENADLIPIALANLKKMKDDMERAAKGDDSNSNGDTISRSDTPTTSGAAQESGTIVLDNLIPESSVRVRKRTVNDMEEKREGGDGGKGGRESPPRKKRKSVALRPISPPLSADENSMSQWNVIKPILIGTHKIFPLTLKMHQRLIIQYLGSIGEYQDMLVLAYEGNSMSLLFDYVSLEFTDDVRLTFDALKYLCSLLVHRKFALEFVSKNGVEKLLKVPSTSLAAVGVATCFYYLSYGVDVMERVCQLDENIIDQVVEYMLWVQEHSHESGMASATMFLSHALAFRAILDRFDAKDGLRKLYNYMSTLTLLQHAATDVDLTEEQVQTSTQTIRNTCAALRTYATSHVFMRVEHYRRLNVAREGATAKAAGDGARVLPTVTPRPHATIAVTFQPPVNIPYYKPMHMEEETLRQAVWMLSGLHKGHYSSWKAMEELRSVGMIKLLLSMLLKAHDWASISAGKIEIAINSVYTIMMAATIPRVQAELCAPVSPDIEVCGLAVLLSLSDDKMYGDAEAPIVGMCAIIACICPPIEQEGSRKKDSTARKQLYGGPAPSSSTKHQQAAADLFSKIVTTIRRNNGLMVLNTMIRSKTPITSADEMRALTCKVLVGMARDQEIRRILLLLPLISQNELHDLMNEPVCPDKKAVHVQFCAEAKNLIAAVTEKSLKDVKKDLTQDRLWKSHIVSSTQIAFNDKELLQLIHAHLQAKGLTAAASALSTEADLAGQQSSTMVNGVANGVAAAAAATGGSAARCLEGLPSLNILTRPPSPSRRGRMMNTLPAAGLKYAATPGGRPRKTKDAGVTPFPRRLPIRTSGSKARGGNEKTMTRSATMQLNDIITEYFRVQHSNCAHPVSTCPPFSLFYPHKCPEPAQSRILPQNVTARWLHSTTYNHQSRRYKSVLDEKFIFSRFRPSKIFQETEEHYTACTFSIDDEHLIVGTFSGEIQWMNLESGLCEATAQCHHSAISGIIPSKDGSMLLTSGLFMNPQSTLWRLGDQQTHLMDFPDDMYVQFNNAAVQDRIVGTTNEKATVYDVETGRTLYTMQNIDRNGQYYQYSKASFSPFDDMVLHDNTLFDLRASNSIVRVFDRMNANNGGCFHPHGNEIIINTEVWDMRSFSLLHSVPVLDQCKLLFNATGNIILAGEFAPQNDPYKTQFSSALKTISSSDYSVISTLDVRKPLMDFCFSHEDAELAVVEVVKSYTQTEYFAARSDETACRTYEVGKVRVPEDGDEEGEQDEDPEMGDGGDSSSSDSDSDEDSEDSGSEEGSSEGALDMLGRMAGESEGSDESEEEEEDGNESGGEDGEDGSSSGWETASNQEDGGEGEEVDVEGLDEDDQNQENEENEDEEDEEAEGSDISIYMDDGSDEEDDRDDPAFNPDVDERGGTSNIILNPNMRRRRGN
ncbi:hypothetical protein PFISCL1PPCAC_16632 [Pristionchus fissidentatus]|uniref:LisH domain-containing protein n=1 Tax=Pristionchus fissidentatus TaxID=1538716 RepID=A0AAV5W4R7_9BILA|nr:hypothetical protein PFISCL1PPCAC_16632 [Pristionchus fissidentatus]